MPGFGISEFENPGNFKPVYKGGDGAWHSFEFPKKGSIWLKSIRNHIGSNDFSDRSPSIKLLVRAAQAAGKIDQDDGLFRDDVIAEERLGIAIGIIRRGKNITREELALKTGYDLEILIALEMGILDVDRLYRVLPGVLGGLGMDLTILNQILKTE